MVVLLKHETPLSRIYTEEKAVMPHIFFFFFFCVVVFVVGFGWGGGIDMAVLKYSDRDMAFELKSNGTPSPMHLPLPFSLGSFAQSILKHTFFLPHALKHPSKP
jgi:hypothetical protein